MGGGVNPLEWILPPVAVSHAIVNEVAPHAGQTRLVTPESQTARTRTKKRDAAEQQRQLGLAQTAKDEEAERLRVENLPENVRRRAGVAAQQ
ncbi:MAG: hypothetical protein ACREVZ_12955, partial [Burkholderiales bacterium]